VKARVAAIVMAVLLVIYLGFVVQYSFVLMGTGVPVAIAMGVALVVLPIIAAWLLLREILFVVRGERLVGDGFVFTHQTIEAAIDAVWGKTAG
jgi:hypothetical protein